MHNSGTTQLAMIAPGKPVLVTLVNTDSDCGDYELQPHGAFLKDTSASIRTCSVRLRQEGQRRLDGPRQLQRAASVAGALSRDRGKLGLLFRKIPERVLFRWRRSRRGGDALAREEADGSEKSQR
jgi:hypothetical protein